MGELYQNQPVEIQDENGMLLPHWARAREEEPLGIIGQLAYWRLKEEDPFRLLEIVVYRGMEFFRELDRKAAEEYPRLVEQIQRSLPKPQTSDPEKLTVYRQMVELPALQEIILKYVTLT